MTRTTIGLASTCMVGMLLGLCLPACDSSTGGEGTSSSREQPGESGGAERSAPASETAAAATPAPPPRAPDLAPAPAEVAPEPAAPAELDPRLLDPGAANAEAPAEFTVELQTTKGPILIDVHRAWAPHGADRFFNLVQIGYFSDVAFFRVIEGFMAQGGIHGDPRVNQAWRRASIPDDPPQQSNTRGMVSYAMAGPGTRTTQFFVNFGDNSNLDSMGFAPFGQLKQESLRVLDALHSGYGEGAPRGRGPMQGQVQQVGNPYLRAEFPELDYIQSARILEN